MAIILLFLTPWLVLRGPRTLKRLISPPRYKISIVVLCSDGFFSYEDITYAYGKEIAAKEFASKINELPVKREIDWSRIMNYVHES
jgi:hypothetical protein